MRVVNPVSRTKIDFKLRYTAGQIPVFSWVTVNQPIDPDQDSRAACAISKGVDSTLKLDRSLNAHVANVAYRLQEVKLNGASTERA